MARTQVRTQQVEDGGIQRVDLNTTTAGSAVIAKVVKGNGIQLGSTGADAGTGDVTVGLETVVVAGTKPKVTYDVYGRVTAGADLAAGDIPAGSTQYVQNQTAAAQSTTNFWISGWGGANEHRAYNGAYFVGFRAPATLTSNYSFSLPASYGTAGYTLFGDGSGGLSWGNVTSSLLTGLAAGSNTAIAATDSILEAMAKLQAQVSAGGGGGGSSTAGHCASMSRAAATDTLGMSTTNTTCYLVDIVADAGFDLSNTSSFEAQILQTSSGSFRFVLTNSAYTVIAYSSVITNPGAGMVTGTMTFVSGTSYTLVPGTRYYAGMMSNQNSPFLLGKAATNNTNQTPYIAAKFDNIGSMTVPTQFTGGGESLLRMYIRLKV